MGLYRSLHRNISCCNSNSLQFGVPYSWHPDCRLQPSYLLHSGNVGQLAGRTNLLLVGICRQMGVAGALVWHLQRAAGGAAAGNRALGCLHCPILLGAHSGRPLCGGSGLLQAQLLAMLYLYVHRQGYPLCSLEHTLCILWRSLLKFVQLKLTL